MAAAGRSLPRRRLPSRTRAAALRGASALARSSGDYAEAIRFGELCLAMCRALDDREGVAGSLNSLCATALAMGCVEDAVRYGEEGLAEVRGTANQRGLGASLTNLGTALRNLDRFESCRPGTAGGRDDVFRALGDLRGRDVDDHQSGHRRAPTRQPARTRGRSCVDALTLCLSLGHAEGQVDCLDVAATIDVAQGRHADGLRLFEIVGAARRRLGLEVSTPDERRDRESAIMLARSALDGATIASVEAEAAEIDITRAAVEFLAAAAHAGSPM